MIRKLSFRKKIFSYFTVIFIIFTVFVLLFQYQREKEFKKEIHEQKLNNIIEIANKYINNNDLSKNKNYRLIDSIKTIIPNNIRITVINPTGIVLYDNKVEDFEKMENHLQRPEIQESVVSDFGANIRKSKTTGKKYYYYSKYYTDYFIRTATVYDIEIKKKLKAENMSLIYICSLFTILLLVLLFVTKNISKTISKLKDFTIKLNAGKKYDKEAIFPNDELGTISKQMIVIYDKLNNAKEKITLANDKLFSHLQALNEGIAFFSLDKKHLLSNNNFIKYMNFIADKSTINPEFFFKLKYAESLINYIDMKINKNVIVNPDNLPSFEIDIQKDGKYFNIWCTIFHDKSFEIVIKDTTKLKKRKLLKQQITSNIAHELKTPVTTIMGYLETLNRNILQEEKQKYFISKAYIQANRLSELIEDIAVLNKIEESRELFKFEKINLINIINDVIDNIKIRLYEKKITVNIEIQKELIIFANKSLLFSIFFNLTDNAIKYGGENIQIDIKKYNEDKKLFYFSFANTGNSIDKKYLTRIFERFYRIEAGRSRKTGGTGLGLSIVKNAIELHSGKISANNNNETGVKFLFTLAK